MSNFRFRFRPSLRHGRRCAKDSFQEFAIRPWMAEQAPLAAFADLQEISGCDVKWAISAPLGDMWCLATV